MNEIKVLVGVAGVGKSTYIKNNKKKMILFYHLMI